MTGQNLIVCLGFSITRRGARAIQERVGTKGANFLETESVNFSATMVRQEVWREKRKVRFFGKGKCELTAIDNLQNYCLGSSRGKSRLLRWLSRWLHSHLHGENDWRLHSSWAARSFLPKLQLSVWLSLDLSLVPYYDADCGDHWFVLGQRISDQRTSGLVLFAQWCRRHPSLRSPSSRAFYQASNRFAIASRKDQRKKILLQTGRFALTGFLSKTENRVGREGVTYRYRDNETSVPRCQVRGTNVSLSRYRYVTPSLPTLFSVLLRKPVRAKRPVCNKIFFLRSFLDAMMI